MNLKNVGEGVTLNVKIESLFVDCMGHYGGSPYLPMKFEKLYSLSPGEKKHVKDAQPDDVATVRVVGAFRPNLLGIIVGRRAYHDTELKIWFTDIIHLGRRGITPDIVQPDNGQVVRTQIIYNKVKW